MKYEKIEEIFDQYIKTGNITEQLEDLRRVIINLQNTEYILAVTYIGKEIKKIGENFLSLYPDESLEINIYTEKEDSDNSVYLNCFLEFNGENIEISEFQELPKHEDHLRQVLFSNISSKDIFDRGLKAMNFDISISKETIEQIESNLLEVFVDENTAKIFNSVKLENTLESNVHNNVKRKKNSI